MLSLTPANVDAVVAEIEAAALRARRGGTANPTEKEYNYEDAWPHYRHC